MIDVYKLSADGQIATLVGKVHNSRDVGDKVRVKSISSPLHVIGKGSSSEPGSHAIYCVTEDDWFYSRTVFNETLFGNKDNDYKQPLNVQIQSASNLASELVLSSQEKTMEHKI